MCARGQPLSTPDRCGWSGSWSFPHPEALLGALFAQPVERADLGPSLPAGPGVGDCVRLQVIQLGQALAYRIQPKQRVRQVGQRLQRAVKSFDMRRIRHSQSLTCQPALSTLCCLLGHSSVDYCGNGSLTFYQGVIADKGVERSVGRYSVAKKKGKKGKKK